MKITELKGNAQVFTLTDGITFRIFARETKEVANDKVSEEMKIAESMGLILMTADAPVVTEKAVVTEEVPTNKKSKQEVQN